MEYVPVVTFINKSEGQCYQAKIAEFGSECVVRCETEAEARAAIIVRLDAVKESYKVKQKDLPAPGTQPPYEPPLLTLL